MKSLSLKMWPFLIFGCFAFLVGLVSTSDTMVHGEVAHRAAELLARDPHESVYGNLLKRHKDAFQAGSVYVDSMYPFQCYSFAFRGWHGGVPDDSHWLPFVNATIRYINATYTKPYTEPAQKLIAFLFGVVSHQIADALWHALGDFQFGTLQEMERHGESGPFDWGDDAADTLVLKDEWQLRYAGLGSKWYIPVKDLVEIYANLYGKESGIVPADAIQDCSLLLFFQKILWRMPGDAKYMRMMASLLDVPVLAPFEELVPKSPYLMRNFYDHPMGGMADMTRQTFASFLRTVTMLEHGIRQCDIPPYNEIVYLAEKCQEYQALNMTDFVPTWNISVLENLTLSDYASPTRAILDRAAPGVNIEQLERGVTYQLSDIGKSLAAKILGDNPGGFPEITDLREETENRKYPSFFIDGELAYEEMGKSLLTSDLNGDGITDLIIGSSGMSDVRGTGSIQVVYGTQQGLSNISSMLELHHGGMLTGFSKTISILDLNLDGFADLVVGAPAAGYQNFTYNGEIYIYFGHKRQSGISHGPDFDVVITCNIYYCNLGHLLTTGDVDGDGFKDLVISSPYPNNEIWSGLVAVFLSGSRWSDVGKILNVEVDSDWTLRGDFPEWFGLKVDASIPGTLFVTSSKQPTEEGGGCFGKLYVFQYPEKQALLESEVYSDFGESIVVAQNREAESVMVAVSNAAKTVVYTGYFFMQSTVQQAGNVQLFNVDLSAGTLEELDSLENYENYQGFGESVFFNDLNGDNKEDLLVGLSRGAGENVRIFLSDEYEDSISEYSKKVTLATKEVSTAALGTQLMLIVVSDENWAQRRYVVVGMPRASRKGKMHNGRVYMYNLDLTESD